MNFKKLLLSFGFLAFTSSPLLADYDIDRLINGSPVPAPNYDLVQGRFYEFRVQSNPIDFNLVEITIQGPNNQHDLVSGAAQGNNFYLPDAGGGVTFLLRLHNATSLTIHAEKQGDAGFNGDKNLNIQAFPTHFTIEPPIVSHQAGTQLIISTLTVKNGAGTVTAYEDGVQISNLWEGIASAVTFSSAVFTNGVANDLAITLNVGAYQDQVTAGPYRPLSDGQNRLYVQHDGDPYFNAGTGGDAPTAEQTSNPFDIISANYTQLIQLFPGEILIPGSGKDSTGQINFPQTAGTAVTQVDVLAVDQFFNPTTFALPATVTFTPDSGTDPSIQVPPVQTMPITGIIRITDTDPVPFLFLDSKTYDVTATPNSGGADQSSIVVGLGPASGYRFVTPPPAIMTTDQPGGYIISIEALRFDGTRNTAVNGTIPGAFLAAQLISGTVEQKNEWVDTNPADDIPQNAELMSFTNGIASMTIIITKAASTMRLHYDDGAPGSPSLTSGDIQVNVGTPGRIHYTILGRQGLLGGETFTPGVYPGNTGTDNLDGLNIQVGQNVVVEARITDRRWNVVAGPSVNGQQLTLEPRSFTSGTTFFFDADYPPVGTGQTAPAVFNNSGQFVNGLGQGPFHVSFRTAGNQAIGASSTVPEPHGPHLSSPINILPSSYQQLVLVAPGETLQPGVDTSVPEFADGKSNTVLAQPAGSPFTVTVHAVDQFFNPVNIGPFPEIDFSFTGTGNSISGNFPEQMTGNTRIYVSAVVLQSGTNMTVFETSALGGTPQTVPIPVTFGSISGFNVTMNTADKDAGETFNLTIEAVDQFGTRVLDYVNTVNLVQLPDVGYDTLSPVTANFTLADQGIITIPVQVFRAANNTQIRVSAGGITGDSPTFNVLPEGTLAAGNPFFRRVVLLGPGETLAPASPTGKTGNTGPGFVVGTNINSDAIPVTIQATDSYFNPLNTVTGPTVSFTSNYPFPYGSVQSADPFNGGQTTTNVILYRAGVTHDVSAHSSGVMSSTSSFIGLSNQLAYVMTLLPGEQHDPGYHTNGGKTPAMTASTQSIGVPFDVQLLATDEWFNLVNNGPAFPAVNDGDTVLDVLGTPNFVILPPNQVQIGGPNKNPFNNNVATKTLIIGATGFFNIIGRDQDRSFLGQQQVQVEVRPGPVYKITVSTNVTANQSFPVTVTYEEGGVVISTLPARNIFMNAVNAIDTGVPATGDVIPTGPFLMQNGVANFSLTYNYVEKMRLKLTDEFAGVAISSQIQVNPSGFNYHVVVPSSATAGSDFFVDIELQDSQAGTRIVDPIYNHDITIDVDVATNPALGYASVSTITINEGFIRVAFNYSKAESIRLILRDYLDHLGHPGVLQKTVGPIDINPGSYRNLVLVAPGETWRPGVTNPDGSPHANGKTGAPLTVNKAELNNYEVKAVDIHWNLVPLDGGQVTFTDIAGEIGPGNPSNQGGAFSGGLFGGQIIFNQSGPNRLTALDAADGSITPQSVDLLVSGSKFLITVATDQFTCAPFTVTVQLTDEFDVPISQGGTITLTALKGGSPATGPLTIQSATLDSTGRAVITGQSYNFAENIQIRVSGLDTTSDSNVISFIPSSIFYSWENVPLTQDVETPFQVQVQAKDGTGVCRGNNVENFTRPGLALTHTGTGNLNQNTIDILQGVGQATLTYDTKESIKLEVNDPWLLGDPPPRPEQAVTPTPNFITFTAGPLAVLENVGDFDLIQGGANVAITYIAKDGTASQNLIGGQNISFTVIPEPGAQGSITMNGKVPAGQHTGITLNNGEHRVEFSPTPDAFGKMTVLVQDAEREDGYSASFEVRVLGVPFAPPGALGLGEDRLPLNSTVALDVAEIDAQLALLGAGGTRNTYYREQGKSTWIPYDDANGIQPVPTAADQAAGRNYELFTQARSYTIEWYSETCFSGICSSELSTIGFHSITVLMIIEDGKLAGFPSPFNPKSAGQDSYMTIQFPMGAPGTVETDIYDLFGQKVWHNEQFVTPTATNHGSIRWFGTNDDGITVANGGYIVRVKAGGSTMKTKVLVVK